MRVSRARESKARVSKASVKEARVSEARASEASDQQKFPFLLHHHPNFYNFFQRAIAPCTGII